MNADKTERISVDKVDFSYGDKKVLYGVSLMVERGQITVLTGPNGSGKSTLLRCLHSSCSPEIKDPKDRARLIAYMPQNEMAAWNYGVRDFILTGRYCHTGFSGFYSRRDRMVTDEVIQWLQIEDLAEQGVQSLSGGEFQKVRLARSLAQEPSYLLLDEPVANLDFGYQNELMELLHRLAVERNMGICATIHNINFAALQADTMVLLPKGSREITGKVEEVMTRENLERTYGIPMQVYRHPLLGVIQACCR